MVASAIDNAFMAKKKQTTDRHNNKGFQMRLHPQLREQLERAVEQNASSISEEVRIAIRERLERLKLWPINMPKS